MTTGTATRNAIRTSNDMNGWQYQVLRELKQRTQSTAARRVHSNLLLGTYISNIVCLYGAAAALIARVKNSEHNFVVMQDCYYLVLSHSLTAGAQHPVESYSEKEVLARNIKYYLVQPRQHLPPMRKHALRKPG